MCTSYRLVEVCTSHTSRSENKAFENGVCKVQGGLEQTLSRDEKAAVAVFLLSDATKSDDDDGDDGDDASEAEGYGENILRSAENTKGARVLKSKSQSKGHSTAHVAR